MFKARAPGSMMLLGEYGVLQGKFALVCAIERFMTVTLIPRHDQTISIRSSLGDYQVELPQLEIVKPFQFVLSVLKKFKNKLSHGCNIIIETEFSDQMGFASSAAVTVATLMTISAWLEIPYSSDELIKLARDVIRNVQGLGSGADVAACVLGGMVAYRAKPYFVEKYNDLPDITAVYSGHKTPTADVVKLVEKKFSFFPELFQQICNCIDHCARRGIQAVKEKNWPLLGHVMTVQQGLMDALGVNTPILNNIIHELRALPEVLGAKISGSGLGDCVIALGKKSDIKITLQGAYCEKI